MRLVQPRAGRARRLHEVGAAGRLPCLDRRAPQLIAARTEASERGRRELMRPVGKQQEQLGRGAEVQRRVALR